MLQWVVIKNQVFLYFLRCLCKSWWMAAVKTDTQLMRWNIIFFIVSNHCPPLPPPHKTKTTKAKTCSLLITLSTLCICAATVHMAKSLCGKVKIFHCSEANLWAEFRIWLRKLWWWCFWREGAGWSLSPPSDLSPPKPSQVHGVLLYSSLGHCCT